MRVIAVLTVNGKTDQAVHSALDDAHFSKDSYGRNNYIYCLHNYVRRSKLVVPGPDTRGISAFIDSGTCRWLNEATSLQLIGASGSQLGLRDID